jgi:DNA-binding MarR family transcriptional regulator
MDEDLFERALNAYLTVLALGEPIRIRIWDNRGLTMTQLRLMHTLASENGITLGSLSQLMNLSPSAMTGVIDRLQRMRLLRRKPDSVDRRAIRIYLTEEGRALLAAFDTTGRAYLHAILRRLGRERLESIIGALSELARAAETVNEAEYDLWGNRVTEVQRAGT